MLKAEIFENNQLSLNETVVSDSVMHESIIFKFPKEWELYQKTVVFKDSENRIFNIVLDNSNAHCISENQCYIPFEVIKPPYFTISVFGVNNEKRVTSTQAEVNVLQSGYELGDQPGEPTPDEFAQILQIVNEAKDYVEDSKGYLNETKNIIEENLELFNEDNTFIFDGGTVGTGELDIDIVVDDELSEFSTNPVQNNVITQRINGITDLIYPVGSIYLSVNNVNPQTLFGGVWEQLKDRFLLGAGDKYSAGNEGGEESVVLTVNELPSHTHSLTNPNASGKPSTYSILYDASAVGMQSTLKTSSVGGNQPHNNMPPYLAVYMWKRIL